MAVAAPRVTSVLFVSEANAVPAQSAVENRVMVTPTVPTRSAVSPRPMSSVSFPARARVDGVELTVLPLALRAEALMHWVRDSFSNTTEMSTRPNGGLQPARRRTSQARAQRNVMRAGVYDVQ